MKLALKEGMIEGDSYFECCRENLWFFDSTKIFYFTVGHTGLIFHFVSFVEI